MAEVWHGDLWGNRTVKNDALWEFDTATLMSTQLPHQAPAYPFVQRDYGVQAAYDEGFSVDDLMPVNSVGIVTARDALTIDMDREALWERVQDFAMTDAEVLRDRYALGKDVRDWKVAFAKSDVIANFGQRHIVPIAYRPFDTRWTYYSGNSRGFLCYPRGEVMRHMQAGNNLAVSYTRTIEGDRAFADFLVADVPITHHTLSIKEVNALAPLYLYPEEGTLETERRVNFDPKIYAEIKQRAGLGGLSEIVSPEPVEGRVSAGRASTGSALTVDLDGGSSAELPPEFPMR